MTLPIAPQNRQPLGPGPERGEAIAINADVLWFRLVASSAPLGGVNVWALRDGLGWAIVDTGFADADSAAQWDAILAQLDGKITRIICTHFHPDHIGMVGNLLRRADVPVFMTAPEWRQAQRLAAPGDAASPSPHLDYLRRCGIDAASLGRVVGAASAAMTSGLPATCQVLTAGDILELGGGSWRVEIGAGHSPAPAILIHERDRLMLVGDQLLMRITPHVGMDDADPGADPLGQYFDYLADGAALAPDMLALPGHGPAFVAAGLRAVEIAAHHRERLDVLAPTLATPRLVSDTVETLFGRPLKGVGLMLGLTEAHAHLRRLVVEGRAQMELDDHGRYLFRT